MPLIEIQADEFPFFYTMVRLLADEWSPPGDEKEDEKATVYMTVAEAQQAYFDGKQSLRWWYRAAEKGTIRSVRAGGSVLFRREDIDAYVLSITKHRDPERELAPLPHAVIPQERPMITIRKGAERGTTQFGGWLDSRHTFSFGDYSDPRHHQFRTLRVINDDRLAPGSGFPTHPHRDMEILTCVLSGQLEHRDSMGNGEVIHAGEWQAMTTGTGITHSEFNPSNTEPVHLLQIWIFPDRRGHTPGYQQKIFSDAEKAGKWRLVASPDGSDGSLVIHQDARVYQSKLDAGQTVTHELKPGRAGYLHVATGTATANGERLTAGDGLRIEDESLVTVTGDELGEVLLFDLA